MIFSIKPSEIFLEQIEGLSNKTKKSLKGKIVLIKINPFRFKAIHSKKFSKVFSVRLNLGGIKKRLIYVILGKIIYLVGLLDRKKDYKDLEKYLKKLIK